MDGNLEEWEQNKAVIRENQRKEIGKSLGRSTKTKATKQRKEQGAKTSKRRKFELVKEGWGQYWDQQIALLSLNQSHWRETSDQIEGKVTRISDYMFGD